MPLHIVVGAGPLGIATARAIALAGHSVRLLTRSAKEAVPGVEQVCVDATGQARLTEALGGADVVYNCASAPYHRWESDLPPLWRSIQGAARAVGTRLVIGTNLYAYGSPDGPMGEESGFHPCSRKGRVRAMLEQEAMSADAAGELPVAIVRGSDFYGPSVRVSALGERFFTPLVRGAAKHAQTLNAKFLGSVHLPHSYTYLPDFAKTMAVVGSDPGLFSTTWHVPSGEPVTGEDLASELSTLLGVNVRAAVTPTIALRFGGFFVPAAKEMIEMLYEFDRPFVIESARSEELLGVMATNRAEALAQTLTWFGLPRLAIPA